MKLKNLIKIFVWILMFLLANNSFASFGDISNPWRSCLEIKKSNPNSTSWVYYIQTPEMAFAKKVYCEMETNGWGWMLLFQRRSWSQNIESCWENLNSFLQNSCWNVDDLAENKSYSIWLWDTISKINIQEYLITQQRNWTIDRNEAFILHSEENIFPNTLDVISFSLKKICNINNESCDNTVATWLYVWTSWFANSYCSLNKDWRNDFKWNYWYCQNWLNWETSNSLFWTRNWYNETKLWWHSWSSKDYMERVYVRNNDWLPENILLSNDKINFNWSWTIWTLTWVEDAYTWNFIFSLVWTWNDNSFFRINWNNLIIENNDETRSSFNIRIKATNENGFFIEKNFLLIKNFSSYSNPILSCQKQKNDFPNSPSWNYWMKLPTMSEPIIVYCEMQQNWWGWTLLFQRRWGRNLENYWTTLNSFLQNKHWNTENLTFQDSYSISVNNFLSQVRIKNYMSLQYTSNMNLTEDSYTLFTDKNIFPNETEVLREFDIDKVCDKNGNNCDTTNVYWKYIWDKWFASASCFKNNLDNRRDYRWNYWYCHNWGWDYSANSLFWTRSWYEETKLWWFWWNSANHMERFFVKFEIDNQSPVITSATPENNTISPDNKQEITVNYTDVNNNINTSSANLRIQKWNSNSNAFEDFSATTENRNVTWTRANFTVWNLTYWKYKFIFSISDSWWLTSNIEKIFYKDYPIITINKAIYNLWVLTPNQEKVSEDIIITVQTVWAWFDIISENERNPTFEVYSIKNWTDLFWYAIKNPAWIWKIFTSEKVASKEKSINTNWNYNTYNYRFNLKMKVDSNQTAWTYEWLFGLRAIFKY